MNKYEVVESFSLNEGETPVEVGQVIELEAEKAEALVAEGKIKAVEETAAPEGEAAPAPEGEAAGESAGEGQA